MTDEPLHPPYYVIAYPMPDGRFCVSIARDGPGKHEIVVREQVAASTEAALQAAEEMARG